MLTCPDCAVTVQPAQRFCANCGKLLTANKPSARLIAPSDIAEHRQLTLIFSDIVGSTTLTSALGAETYRELLRSFHEITARIVNQYQGHLARFEGDGMMIHFGYPIAREDDAFRAVQACLDLQEAVGVLNERYRLAGSADFFQIRIAVHTGTVIAGDIQSETTVEQMAIVGEAANIAARLQSLANPGSTIISQNTYDLVGGNFDCRYLGAPSLKGVDRPVKIFEVHVAEMGEELRRGPARARMIGREKEISDLQRLWECALTGESSLAVVVGEAGVGKSRLLRELFAALEDQKFLSIVLKCAPLYQQSALHPFVKFLTDTLGLSGIPPAEKFDRLARALKLRFADPDEHIFILANVLSVPLPGDRITPREYTPQQEKARFEEILTAWLLRETESQPVLLVVEDMHWADPSTIELLSAILPKLTNVRSCSIMTFRDDCDRSWIDRLQPHIIALHRLDKEQTYNLIREIAIGRSLSSEILETLNARTDGVPLFIEEMTRLVMENDLASAEGVGAFPLKLPATLQQSLNARIDRVGADREILHLCATIGREFEHEMITAIWDGDPTLLLSEMKKLSDAGILEPSGVPPRRKWIFKHALIQEKIYEFALSAHRRDAHAKIATAIQARLPAICSDNPEILAQHFLEARMDSNAFPFIRKAAEKAIQRSAIREASHHLNAALKIVSALPVTAEMTSQKLQLLLQAGVVQTAISGYASPEVGRCFQQARELSRGLDLSVGVFPALHGLYRFYFVRADMADASELADELLSIAETSTDPGLLLEAHRAVANCAFQKGEFARATGHFNTSLSHYDRTLHASHRFTFGIDPFVGASSMAAMNAFLLGDAETAMLINERGVAASETLGHPFTQCWALTYSLVLQQLSGRTEDVRALAERVIELSDHYRFPFWKIGGTIMQGWWLHTTGKDRASGIKMMTHAIASWERLGATAFLAYFTSLLVEAHLREGDHAAATSIALRALQTAQTKGEMWWIPELLHFLCVAACMNDNKQESGAAKSMMAQALELSRRQKSRYLERRLLTSLERQDCLGGSG
jgi:class 3 adenylate cyclase/tetratricopeptide (TPR) repeat protein